MMIGGFRRESGVCRAAALLIFGALLPLAPVAGQSEAPPVAEDEIVVTGTRDQARAIKNYVDGLTLVVSGDPLARYEPGVYCPAVVGLSANRNRQIASRMRAVAAAAGVEPAPDECKPSALVIFVDNRESFLKEFRKTHPVYFSNPSGDAWTPSKGSGPAVAWNLVQQIDPNGVPVQRESKFGPATVSTNMRGSRLLSMIETAVAMSVLIVERQALRGLTVTQIADYSLMRTLTDPGAAGSRVPSQLTILQALEAPIGSAVPQSVTEIDLAYLKGRYSGHPASYGDRQRAAIQRSIKRSVKAAEKQ